MRAPFVFCLLALLVGCGDTVSNSSSDSGLDGGDLSCPPPAAPANGSVDWESLGPGDTATYACEAGYSLVGDATRVCLSSSIWTGSDPSCERPCELWSSEIFSLYREGVDDYGLNLDQLATTTDSPQVPANGCGVIDGPEGVDNQFALLLALLDSVGIDVQDAIDERVSSKLLTLEITLAGYEGAGSEQVRFSLAMNGEIAPEHRDRPGVVDATGNVRVEISTLTIPIHLEIQEMQVEISLRVEQAELFIEAPGESTYGTVRLGGRLRYEDPSAPDDSLRAQVLAVLTALDEAYYIGYVDSAAPGFMDLSSNGTDCDRISFGAELVAARDACH